MQVTVWGWIKCKVTVSYCSSCKRKEVPSFPARRRPGAPSQTSSTISMAPSLIRACRSVALSTCLLSFCFVHFLCLDFTVAEKEEWYTAFVNITYLDPVTSEVKTEKSECGRYGEHSPKKEVRGLVLVPSLQQDRQACDPTLRFPPVSQNTAWVALVAAGNCTFREKIRNVAHHNASAVVVYNVGSSSANDTITMPHPGKRQPVNPKEKSSFRPVLLFPGLIEFLASGSIFRPFLFSMFSVK